MAKGPETGPFSVCRRSSLYCAVELPPCDDDPSCCWIGSLFGEVVVLLLSEDVLPLAVPRVETDPVADGERDVLTSVDVRVELRRCSTETPTLGDVSRVRIVVRRFTDTLGSFTSS